jgi:hypothetical protein
MRTQVQSKNKRKPNAAEAAHIERVKLMPCCVCNAAGPSDAHELRQGDWFTCLPLCRDCHMGAHNGIHGRQAIWKVKKLDELGALNLTIQELVG